MFVKGKSGNPNGRPKKYTILDYITPDEVDGLVKTAKRLAIEKGDTVLLKTLLEHIFGKPAQPIVGGNVGDEFQPILVKFINNENDRDTNRIQAVV